MVERLGEMRKGRRERIEKGSHCFFKSSGYDKLELTVHEIVICMKIVTVFTTASIRVSHCYYPAQKT